METFLRKLNLSEFAIEIYLQLLYKFPLTYYEIHSIVPKITLEEFNNIISELLNIGLITQQPSQKEDPITHYRALPPIYPILTYYNNINANLGDIKNSIQELM
ncbi:MAG: helix-turn-helix domain-containing protein, partial [Candidatus Odinarchaeota archaeon]